jgi:uncharacterized protein involved in exopolysaccharide biosynthesis
MKGLIPVIGCCLLLGAGTVAAQKPAATKANATASDTAPASVAHSSAAYAELLLKRTELQSELESLMVDYTEEYPRVKEIRFVLSLIDRDAARLKNVKAADAAKLTLALGKLMTRKIELETELWKLRETYKDEHPEVKRAKKKVEIFEKAIAEILD